MRQCRRRHCRTQHPRIRRTVDSQDVRGGTRGDICRVRAPHAFVGMAGAKLDYILISDPRAVGDWVVAQLAAVFCLYTASIHLASCFYSSHWLWEKNSTSRIQIHSFTASLIYRLKAHKSISKFTKLNTLIIYFSSIYVGLQVVE